MLGFLFRRKTLVNYINDNDLENVKLHKDQLTDSIYINAIKEKKYEVVKILFNGSQIPLLIEYHHNDLVKTLPIIDEYLIIACKHKNHTLVEHFVLNGADINFIDKFQFNCLTYTFPEKLIKRGAN